MFALFAALGWQVDKIRRLCIARYQGRAYLALGFQPSKNRNPSTPRELTAPASSPDGVLPVAMGHDGQTKGSWPSVRVFCRREGLPKTCGLDCLQQFAIALRMQLSAQHRSVEVGIQLCSSAVMSLCVFFRSRTGLLPLRRSLLKDPRRGAQLWQIKMNNPRPPV